MSSDPHAPQFPPPSFNSPEGIYILAPTIWPNSLLNPPPPPTPSGPNSFGFNSAGSAGGFGGMSPAMAMAGMSMGGLPSGMMGVGLGVGTSAPPVIASGPVAGPAFGQSNGPNGVPNPWPVKASFVTMIIANKEKGAGGEMVVGGGFGGMLGRNKKQQDSQQQVVEISAEKMDGGSSDEEDNVNDGGGRYDPRLGKSRQPPRPKNNLRSTNSTFVTRVVTHETFTRLLQHPPHLDSGVFSSSTFSNTPPRGTNPPPTHWAFANAGRTLVWALVDPTLKNKEALMRINFASNVSCHAVCGGTKVAPGNVGERLDVAVGFGSGDIIWLDPIISKYSRLSKGGIVYNVPVVQLRFHPQNPTIIYALYSDGVMLVYSTERDDPPYQVTSSPPPWIAPMNAAIYTAEQAAQPHAVDENRSHGHGSGSGHGSGTGFDAEYTPGGPFGSAVEFEKERERAKKSEMFFVWRNEDVVQEKKKGEQQVGAVAWAGRNPVAAWRVGTKGIRQFEFSPDGQVMATVSEDGVLKVIEMASEKVLDAYAGYFGALSCLTWSPDGRYLLAGGQDDLISIYSPREGRLVARCQGHSSFITNIVFDRRKTNARGYRFGSVGEDGRLLFWDFSAASLQRPRHVLTHSRRRSLGSVVSFGKGGKADGGLGGESGLEMTMADGSTYHVAPLRSDVAVLQPVMNKLIEPCMLNCLTFLTEAVVTVSRAGGVKFWTRPVDLSRRTAAKKGGALGIQSGMKDLKMGTQMGQRADVRVGA